MACLARAQVSWFRHLVLSSMESADLMLSAYRSRDLWSSLMASEMVFNSLEVMVILFKVLSKTRSKRGKFFDISLGQWEL